VALLRIREDLSDQLGGDATPAERILVDEIAGIHYGQSAEHQLRSCVRATGVRLGVLIDEGTWTPAAAVRVVPVDSQGKATGMAAGASVEERLRYLDKLRADGVITDDEYRDRRQRILNEL